MAEITEPGIYELDHADYLADPVPGGSLSHTGARRILPPGCPAKFRWWADHPPEPTEAFDVGHAAHRELLGVGPDIVVVDAADWRTKAAKEAKAEAHEQGKTPMLADQYERVKRMIKLVREHPIAGALFAPGTGWPEASLFWRDDPTSDMLRARLDWLPEQLDTRRMIVPDYKTCDSADPEILQRAVYQHGYYTQAAWYLDGVRALALDDDPAFVLVFQEKDEPHLVTVVELDMVALRIGRQRNRQAIDLYARCRATDTWPGYTDDIELVSLPAWVERQHYEEAIV